MALDPRIRDSAGQFSSKGTVTARALRKAWSVVPRTPRAKVAFSAKTGPVLEFDAVASTFTADKIDTVNAIIKGVSVITSGLIARGHDLEVDKVTLDQMQKCADSKGQVPVKVDHKSGAAAVCGFLTNFRQEDNKLKADWHLLQSHPQKDQILEVAQRMPRGVGLSASFVSPDKPERTKAGKAAARCHELISVDYVTLPAANPDGMFAAKVDSSTSPMNPETLAAIKAAIAEAVAPLTEKIAALEAQNQPQEELTLDQVAEMNEAQLAEHGLTREDVIAAIEAIQSEDGAGDGEDLGAEASAEDGEGELATAGAGEGAGKGAAASAANSTGFAALSKQITELGAKFAAFEGKKEADSESELLTSIETNFEILSKENERLTKALQAGGEPASAGVDRNGIRFFSAKDGGEFENLVQFEVESNKIPKGKAFSAVIAANPAAYNDYLVRKGVRKAE